MNRIRLKEGKDKKIRNQYPWIFRDDIATNFKDRGHLEDGSIVEVADAEDKFLAIGTYNSKSHIVVRILSKQNVAINRDFLFHRIKRAIEYRQGLIIPSNAKRLIHAEADRLPGLMVDQYGDKVVVQFRSLGMELFRKDIIEILAELCRPKGIFDRSDMESRADEGLEMTHGTVYGEVPQWTEITEHDMKFRLDVHQGHKTGFYLDQRDNRFLVQSLVKPNQKCLDLFSYTGGFAVALAKAGGNVRAIDTDPAAIAVIQENAQLNGVSKRIEGIQADVFDYLEEQAKIKETNPGNVQKYDLIVIDPPAFAKRKEGMDKLKWAYWKLLLNSFKLLNPGGYVVLSSCAYHMSIDLMLEAARFASADLGLMLRVANVTYQPPDHPWISQIPESLYLKTVYFQLT